MFNKNSIINAALGTALSLSILACKKDNENEGQDTHGFTEKEWKLDAMTVSPAVDLDGDGVPDSDLIQFMDDCDKDDITIFRKNSKVITNYGPLKCDNESQEEETGTWSYQESTKKLTLHEEGSSLEVEVTESTSNRFAFRYSSPDNPDYTIRITYKR